ncbi:MAG: ATP-binding cassette domain-containing protein [Bradymonadaceae bacterium]
MPILSAQGLTWSPEQDGTPLFEDVELNVEAGERVIITGHSGSGKSTLLRCLTLLEPVQRGEVLWRGERVTAENVRHYRNRVVSVQQRPVAIAETIDENLRFSQKITRELSGGKVEPLSDEEQDALLDRLGLSEIGRERRFEDLSVGEQQRVALVRCLTPQPDILLLDEPTASLDPTNVGVVEELLLEYLAEKSTERALIWISHHPDQIERLEGRVVSMEELKQS